MVEPDQEREQRALFADGEELRDYLHDQSMRVLRAVLANRNLSEEDALVIVNRKNVTPDILESIAKDRRWADSYPIRLALARNPRSPLTVSLAIARFLRIFDLEEITRNHYLPLVFRHKVEAMIMERVPTMPLGNKKTLAKKAAGAVLLKLLQDRIPEVVRLALDNPHMIESHLYKVISRADTMAETVLMIAEHPQWSTRPLIRFALIRNAQTPLATSAHFLARMNLGYLSELYADPSLPLSVKPLVHRELLARGHEPDLAQEDIVYEISEEEMNQLETEMTMPGTDGDRWDDAGEGNEKNVG